MPKDHMTKEEFWLEFFGNYGRELADPKQYFTDNPNDIIKFVADCTEQKKPAFISVNPRETHGIVAGIEKLFFDFDYGSKKDDFTPEEIAIKSAELTLEVEAFIDWLKSKNIIPLVIKTRKGFHVHVYLQNLLVLQTYDLDVYRKMYELLQLSLLRRFGRLKEYREQYFDTSVLGDVKRVCRIPLSIHQKSGEECYLVDNIHFGKITKGKIRGIGQYTPYRDVSWVYPVAVQAVAREKEELAKKLAELKIQREQNKDRWEMKHGFIGQVRPCFEAQIEKGEMGHPQRLALILEAYFANYDTPDKLNEFFSRFRDWDGDQPSSKCRDQIDYFFEVTVPKIAKGLRPYACKTLQEKNWCIYNDCPLYRKRKEYKQKPKKK